MRDKSKELNTLWTDHNRKHTKLGDDFEDDVMKRIKNRVTLRDYLFMCLQGFFNVFVGLLKGIPTTNSPEIESEKKKP